MLDIILRLKQSPILLDKAQFCFIICVLVSADEHRLYVELLTARKKTFKKEKFELGMTVHIFDASTQEEGW